jgi:hypothetical protein
MNLHRDKASLKPLHPDVLGAITRGPRINMDVLECVMGIYPRMAYINQPIEVVVVLQSMIDQDINLKAAIRMPTTDRKGNVVIIETAKPQVSVSLTPGEVGVLRMPIIARPPTQPGKDFPVRVAIRFRNSPGNIVRPPGGGAPPSVLSVSPFKLQVLQEIEFVAHKWNDSHEIVTVNFDLAPKSMPGNPELPQARYETLWTQEGMKEEIRLARSHYEEAVQMAKPAATGALYLSFMDAVEERFARRGIPLHPGETMAIAKMMSYTVEDAPQREPDVVLEDTRWFRSLCQVLAHNPALLELERNEILGQHVFEGVLYEAVLLAFNVVASRVKEDLGNPAERLNYANRFMKWFSGAGDPDLTYVYLPLVLGGVVIGRIVRSGYRENAWDLYDQLIEAYNGRSRLISGEAVVIFDMLAELLENYARILRSQRIERPDDH